MSSSESSSYPLCSNCEHNSNAKQGHPKAVASISRMEIMMCVMFVVLIANLSLSVYTLNVVHNASTQLSTGTQSISDVTTQLTQLNTLATNLNDAIGPATRLNFNMFPINVPNVLNELLRVPFRDASANLTRMASAVELAMREHDSASDMLDVARWAILIGSITQQVGYLKKVVGPGVPVEDPANNDVLHFITSALLNVIDFQFDSPEPWNRLAVTCMAFVDHFLAVNWSGTYRDQYGNVETWNINESIANPFQQIFDYCAALSNLTLPGGSLLDMLDENGNMLKKGEWN